MTECITRNAKLAVEGQVFEDAARLLQREDRQLFVSLCRIVARANAQQKQQVILLQQFYLREHDYCIGFVGDGSNDCKALQAANMGLSIGNNDSSITASFSTPCENISPVIDLLKEGKFGMENSSQLISVYLYGSITGNFGLLILGLYGLNLTDFDYALGFFYFFPGFFFLSTSLPIDKLNFLYPRARVFTSEFMLEFIPLTLYYIAITYVFFFLIISDSITKPTTGVMKPKDISFSD